MESRDICLDIESSKHTNQEINDLVEYISGQISYTSLIFLQKICVKNAASIEKLLIKCHQLKINLKSSDVNRVIDSLHNQMNLPKNILESIQYYILDKRMHGMKNLNSTSYQLDTETYDSMLKPNMQIVDNLNFFIQSNQEEQFLKSIITMMVEFQNKDHHCVKSCNPRKNATDDTSKWLRTLLNVSEKSDLTKLIYLIADRLNLGETVISGENRNMDLTELFFIFEEMALQSEILVIHESNKKIMLDINAILLTSHVCNKAPNAFFDIVSLQQNNNDSILSVIKRHYQKSLIIESFFQHSSFQQYFRKHSHDDKANQHAFLISLSTRMESILLHNNDSNESNIRDIAQFINTNQKIGKKDFLHWVEQIINEHSIDKIMYDILNAIEHEAEIHNNRLGSLVFIANKLVSMGFSPRAASVATSGFFQPLITTHVPKIDLENFRSLKNFSETLKPHQRQQLIQELILSVIANSRKRNTIQKSPSKSQQKSKNRMVDNHYPIPIFQSIKSNRNTRKNNKAGEIIHKVSNSLILQVGHKSSNTTLIPRSLTSVEFAKKFNDYPIRHPSLHVRTKKTNQHQQNKHYISTNGIKKENMPIYKSKFFSVVKKEKFTYASTFFTAPHKRLNRTNNTPTHQSGINPMRFR